MLVYGDPSREVETAEALAGLQARLLAAGRDAGLLRHEGLVSALVEAGMLAQGLADHACPAHRGCDDLDPVAEAALDLACAIARRVAESWRSDFAAATLPCADVEAALQRLAGSVLPPTISVREPEGFAHYAVYPESYLDAAGAAPPGPAFILGLRSIGTTLAAMAAAGRPSVTGIATLRPRGDPFRRRIRVSARLRDHLVRAVAGARLLVVDEGPGLSGSSFAAAIRLGIELGLPPDRIHLLPSHGGEPGPEADAEARPLWRSVSRHVRTLDETILAAPSPAHRLEAWCQDLTGPLDEPPRDLSGGAWRRELGWPEESWPPVLGWQERRKLLLRGRTGSWLARFVGLGRTGAVKLATAERLAEAGFAPRPAGLRHGFLIEPWLPDARPADPGRDRAALVGRLGAYLAFRATLPSPAGTRGATVADLLAMLAQNVAEALGDEAAATVARLWRPRLRRFAALHRPVLTDNRMQPWEWLESGGRILKADALDHHAGHDLVGCQDVGWDIAGAAVEFALSRPEVDRLADAVAATTGKRPDPAHLAFLAASYCAFQLGYYRAGAATVTGIEAARLEHRARLYLSATRLCLQQDASMPEDWQRNLEDQRYLP